MLVPFLPCSRCAYDIAVKTIQVSVKYGMSAVKDTTQRRDGSLISVEEIIPSQCLNIFFSRPVRRDLNIVKFSGFLERYFNELFDLLVRCFQPCVSQGRQSTKVWLVPTGNEELHRYILANSTSTTAGGEI